MELCVEACTQLRLPCNGLRPPHHRGDRRASRAEVLTQHDIRVEDGHEVLKAATPGGGVERADYRPLPGDIGVLRPRLGALDPAPGPAGQLPGGVRRPADHGGDLVEGQLEQVMEHER